MSYDVPADAINLMALNDLEYPPRDALTLTGLRSATAHVIDAAARHMGTTRIAAHAKLWPQARKLASKRTMPAQGDLIRLAQFTDCCIEQSLDDQRSVRRLLSDLSHSPSEAHPDRAPHELVRLLAGALTWLPLLDKSTDAFALEGLPVGLLLLDALAEHGVTDTGIDNAGGRAPEHIAVGPEGVIRISAAEDENVSRLPAATWGLQVEFIDDTGGCTTPHDSTGTPVTPALIGEVADLVAKLARDLRI
ncbi:hypothetical protein NE857_34070 (plasmid) [Nocardiopsis exhalans]|uniref:Uncharacterized protein n=1 Tax=Nocardiopsis exhalans TaxID=163604 RepID=A0ABY5DJS9_9ACTN|nr:hypothetical protein [Nocardiopsis exhalans]USY23561.1 hypothetical protein NE857_34070 [Nocardiopsis exhalans]